MHNRLLVFILLAALVLMLFAGGVLTLILFSGGSAGATLSTGRSVATTTDSFWLETSSTRDTMHIYTSGQSILVCPAEVTIDGQLLAKLDVAAKDIQIHVSKNNVTVMSDGRPITPVTSP